MAKTWQKHMFLYCLSAQDHVSHWRHCYEIIYYFRDVDEFHLCISLYALLLHGVGNRREQIHNPEKYCACSTVVSAFSFRKFMYPSTPSLSIFSCKTWNSLFFVFIKKNQKKIIRTFIENVEVSNCLPAKCDETYPHNVPDAVFTERIPKILPEHFSDMKRSFVLMTCCSDTMHLVLRCQIMKMGQHFIRMTPYIPTLLHFENGWIQILEWKDYSTSSHGQRDFCFIVNVLIKVLHFILNRNLKR